MIGVLVIQPLGNWSSVIDLLTIDLLTIDHRPLTVPID